MAGYPGYTGSRLAWEPVAEWSVSGSGCVERLEAEIGSLTCRTTCGAGGPAPPAVEVAENAESEGATAGAGAAIQVARTAAPSRPRRLFLHRCVVTQSF
ncbi:hypothetical protein GCM10009525_49660 [Streptosporangium amethystogenes subsp. fukuiense]